MFYTLAYVIMALGSFGMILLLSRQGFEADQLDDFKGLNARSPWFAAVMLMLMFSTAGVPPFIGFFAKLYVILAVLEVGMAWLAAVAVFFSVIGAFYYIRIVKLMYFDDPQDTHAADGGPRDALHVEPQRLRGARARPLAGRTADARGTRFTLISASPFL